MYRYIVECVGILRDVSVYGGRCRYVLHRECGGKLVECVGVLWNVSVCFFTWGGDGKLVECDSLWKHADTFHSASTHPTIHRHIPQASSHTPDVKHTDTFHNIPTHSTGIPSHSL